MFSRNYPNWFHWGHWISCNFPPSSLYEWSANSAQRLCSSTLKLYVSSRADLIRSQSQRQLGQSNKLYCNATLCQAPRLSLCVRTVMARYINNISFKLDATETEEVDKLS